MWWYRLMGKKSLITTIQVNFMLIPSEAEMRQHKLTWIVDCKLFAISLYHYSHFLATCPLWFHNLFLSFFMHTGHFEQDRIVFLQPGCFWMYTKSAVNIHEYELVNSFLVWCWRRFTCNIIKSTNILIKCEVLTINK